MSVWIWAALTATSWTRTSSIQGHSIVPGMPPKPDFVNEILATGFALPTTLEFPPGGRMLLAERRERSWCCDPLHPGRSDAVPHLWTFNKYDSTAANPTQTYSAAGQYSAGLTLSDGTNTTSSAPITITFGDRPTATILTAQDGPPSGRAT